MHRPVFILHILILLAFLAVPARAMAEDAASMLYQVTGIEVDVTAKSAPAARDLAIQTAQRKGLAQLAEQLEADLPMDKISDTDVSNLVKNFDVEQEKHSSTRSIGRYTVQFRPAATRRFLEKIGVRYSEKTPETLLVLPIIKANKRFILWEEPTAWRNAWESGTRRADHLTFPTGDLDDVKLISTNEAIGGKASALHALIEKYKATGGAAVALLTPATDKEEGKLETSLYDTSGAFVSTDTQTVPVIPPNSPDDAHLHDLVKDTRKSLRIKRPTDSAGPIDVTVGVSGQIPTATEAPPHDTLPITVSINSLPEWTTIKRQIDSLPMVDNTTLNTIARGSATFDLTYHGPLHDLQTALSDNHMALGQSGAKGDWVLRLESTTGVTP